VAFLFTDVEGSTALWEHHAQSMESALARHDAILRPAIKAHDGYLFSTQGDAFAAAFNTVSEAVDSAAAAQRALDAEPWPEDCRIRVRMGIHCGGTQERDGDYFGPVLSRGARIMEAAHGGQVLLSEAAVGLLSSTGKSKWEVLDLGEYQLRDLTKPDRLFQLQISGIQSEFPVPRTRRRASDLPVQSTPFVGREAEGDALAELLAGENARLITITGPGGVGKTRLAVQVASLQAEGFSDGVFFVALDTVASADGVPRAVASALGMLSVEDDDAEESVLRQLRARQALLVVDNFEHLMDAAQFLSRLLSACPDVKLLVTSREKHHSSSRSMTSGRSVSMSIFIRSCADFPASLTVNCNRHRACGFMPNLSLAFTISSLNSRMRLLSGFSMSPRLPCTNGASSTIRRNRSR